MAYPDLSVRIGTVFPLIEFAEPYSSTRWNGLCLSAGQDPYQLEQRQIHGDDDASHDDA